MSLNSSSQEMTKTREQVKEERKQRNTEEVAAPEVRVRVRLFPIWLRVIVIILLMAISIIVGAIIGYSVMGDGRAMDIFQLETWAHIIDLVNEK